MAADDLSQQLAARQQAYRLIFRDRENIATWMQRLLAGITAAPPPAGTPPAAGTGAPPADAAAERAAALRKLSELISGHSADYASQPQMKQLLDSVTQRLQSRATALESGTGAGGPLAGLLAALQPGGGAAPAGTPQVAAAAAPAAAAPRAALMSAEAPPETPPVVPPAPGQGATGWLSDVGGGLTTPVTPVGLGGQPAPPAASGTGGLSSGTGGYGAPQTPQNWDKNPYGAGATYSSDTDSWTPPDQYQSQPEQPAAPAAPAGPTPAQLDAWAKAAQTDFNYAANLRNAAALTTTSASTKKEQLARAVMYEARAKEYMARVPGASAS